MWHLKSITAEHLCSFEKFDYELKQNTATLVFGNNMDSDSQNSNGAGKSALIESVAVLLTGEPLRKVNTDEIINDNFDDLRIAGTLRNDSDGSEMRVVREFFRKKPQAVSVTVDGEAVIQSGVADYNKYVLDQIGITKEDVYSNFVLTARKYKSFLSSSDKEKKDIINRFSNGIIVDESIEALQNDIAPVESRLADAERKVAECNGKVRAMEETIERTVSESSSRRSKRQESIEAHKRSIAEKRAEIREIGRRIEKSEDRLDMIDRLDEAIQEIEKRDDLPVKELSKRIKDAFAAAEMPDPKDFSAEADELSGTLDSHRRKAEEIGLQIERHKDAVGFAERKFNELHATYEKTLAAFERESGQIKACIDELLAKARELRDKEVGLDTKRRQTENSITRLEAEISGAVKCPKCGHSFLLGSNEGLEQAAAERDALKRSVDSMNESIRQIQREYDKCRDSGQAKRMEENDLQAKKDGFVRSHNELKTKLDMCRNLLSGERDKFDGMNESVRRVQSRLDNIRNDMFDDAYGRIDRAIEEGEADVKKGNLETATIEGVIKSLENAVGELESSDNEESLLASLSEAKASSERELASALREKEGVEKELNVLKVQENTFLEFKTHLANTKIEAISQIINEFLEAIGSDIRISLSGYSVTKTGKIRDKISVSLFRDGIDCGSFDKFSKGEQTRVELASILALHKLINVNADEFKGLNLLIVDEILDATDEQGLANVFKALNDTRITSLVISHAQVAEGYPNRLVINKKNGVSFI